MAELQVATTQDYVTDSWFWTVFAGEISYNVKHDGYTGTT